MTAPGDGAGSGAGGRGGPGGRAALWWSAAAYLMLAVALWGRVWTGHPAGVSVCACGDAARFMWFLEWPVFAMAHGHDLFFSTAAFHPGGLDVLDDTSVLAIGVVLSPITALFGPVVADNVALTLAPALDALAMYVLVRHFVRRRGVAWSAGLVYGFSPFVVTELAYNQLNLATLALVPLGVNLLDDLVRRGRRAPATDGALLAAVVVAEFFVSTEMLLITSVAVVLALAALFFWGGPAKETARRAARLRVGHGLAVTLAGSAALLAYPLWVAFFGRAHLAGPIWPNQSISVYGTTAASFVTTSASASLAQSMHLFGGYQGPALPNLGYLGIGMVVVVVGGALVFRHDRRIWLFGGVGLIAALCSLQPGSGRWWAPWGALRHLPLVDDVVEVRLSAVTTFCAAIVLALVVDACCDRVGGRARWRPAAALAGVALFGAVVASDAAGLAPNLPLVTAPVAVPAWFATVGTRLPADQVVMAYPAPFSGLQAAMAWQATDGLRYAIVGGGGPAGVPQRAGAQRPGFDVLAAASLGLGPAPAATPANVAAVRQALAAWGVTVVVVPGPALPLYARGRSPALAAALFTVALGRGPELVAGAFVWPDVGSAPAPAPLDIGAAAVARCLPLTADRTTAGVSRAVACVLAAARRR